MREVRERGTNYWLCDPLGPGSGRAIAEIMAPMLVEADLTELILSRQPATLVEREKIAKGFRRAAKESQ